MAAEFERGKAYIVDRGKPKLRSGQGMLAGLDVVIRHFAAAFGKKNRNASQISGVFTVQYPEERLALPEATRNFPILLYDDRSGQELCTSCFQCERICPPQVIHMTQASDPLTGKPVPAVSEFVIEYDACMSCGLCAEVCPFDAIKMDHAFELANADHDSMTVAKAALNQPISYYALLAPRMWNAVKDGALKKLASNTKRRSGMIGVAQGYAGQPPAELPAPVPAAAPPAEAAPAKTTPEDKAARLAAIRAKNAAKDGAAPEAIVAPPLVIAAPEAPDAAAPDDAKAARLAEIRARNAAKRGEAPVGAVAPAADIQLPASESNQDDNDEPDDAGNHWKTTGAAMPDAKAARLAAIRAKNAAKKQQETE